MVAFISLILSILSIASNPAVAVNNKRGVCASAKNALCSDFDLLTSSSWTYNWVKESSFSKLGCDPLPPQEFVPMIATYSGNDFTQDMIEPGAKYLLGFNEPNRIAQANLSPQKAFEGWKKIQATWGDNHTLVSPAVGSCSSSNGKCIAEFATQFEWFDEFFRLCNGTCDISYVATHAYKPVAQQTMNFLQRLYDRYGYQIWLTEFACNTGGMTATVQEQIDYIEELLPLLDASPIVFRYAWFTSRNPSNGSNLLFPYSDLSGGTSHLTEVGQVYNDVGGSSQSSGSLNHGRLKIAMYAFQVLIFISGFVIGLLVMYTFTAGTKLCICKKKRSYIKFVPESEILEAETCALDLEQSQN